MEAVPRWESLYTNDGRDRSKQMIETARNAGLLALYQLTVALGILLMPIALLARRAGVPLPMGRLVEAVGTAYEDAAE